MCEAYPTSEFFRATVIEGKLIVCAGDLVQS
jgi:hypothetical protein